MKPDTEGKLVVVLNITGADMTYLPPPILARLFIAAGILLGAIPSADSQAQTQQTPKQGHGHVQTTGTAHASNYAGQQDRPIKSLSEQDIAELRKGGGWGMAKAAELNGLPGPAHLLELADEIPLLTGQRAAVQEIYQQMKKAAKAEGEKLIEAEHALNLAFQNGAMSAESLKALLADISQSTNRLRFIHLSTHLKTPDILSADQIARYNVLRGYANGAD